MENTWVHISSTTFSDASFLYMLIDLPLHEDWELQSFLPLRVNQRYVTLTNTKAGFGMFIHVSTSNIVAHTYNVFQSIVESNLVIIALVLLYSAL